MRRHSRGKRRFVSPGVLASLLLAVCATLAAYYGTKPPAAEPPDAPVEEFSSGRAMEHMYRIGQEPHPIGSPENTEVREYVFDELTSLGLDPQVQTATVVDEQYGSPFNVGTAKNVLVRIEGARGGKGGRQAAMLAAHYDSVPTGPGANDDGTGVAALLETARALTSGPPLRNDVILLFTDGEETELLGSKAFVEEHPWADEVGVTLNFEARGGGGPSAVFEITPNAREWQLVEGVARAAPRPIASSFTSEIYRRLRLQTDLLVFSREAGIAGMNFAYFRGTTRYHTALDTPSNVDENSLQHHGSYALALARYFGNGGPKVMSPAAPGMGKPVYFDVLGLFLVRYPAGWALVFSAFVAILFVGVVVLGLRRRLLTVRGTLGGLLASLLALVLVPAVTAALLPLLRFLGGGHPVDISRGDVYYSAIYSLGFLAAILAVAIALYGFAGRQVGVRNLAVGAFVPWLVLCVLSAVLVPRVSFLFTWPLLLALAGVAASFLLSDAPRGSPASYTRAALLLISGASAIALLAPFIYLLHFALTVGSAAVTAVFVVFGVGLLVGHVALAGSEGVRVPVWASLGLAFAAAGLFLAGGLLSGFDADHPRPDSILYALDADSGEAIWATLDDETDAYTSRFIGQTPERRRLEDFLTVGPPALVDEAPTVPLAAPAVEVLGDHASGDTRTLRLRVSSPRGAKYLSLRLQSDDPQDPDTPVLSAAVDGEPVDEPTDLGPWGRWGVEFRTLPKDGVVLTLEVRAGAPLQLRVVDSSDGLPDVPGIDETRPADTMPQYELPEGVTPFADATFVGKSFDLTERR